MKKKRQKRGSLMKKKDYYQKMREPYQKDYCIYLNVKELYSCQKDFSKLCNQDELQFQIVHQVEELWMKLMKKTTACSNLQSFNILRLYHYFRFQFFHFHLHCYMDAVLLSSSGFRIRGITDINSG